MENYDAILKLVSENKARAAHWRSAHYDCARWYQVLEYSLGIPSVVLATVILGFAFYAVDRPSAPLWTQYTLAGLAVLQGIVAAVQSYVRPGALAERYRISATNFGSMQRKWHGVEQKLALDVKPTTEELNAIHVEVDQAVREALPVAGHIFRRVGRDPSYYGKSSSAMNRDQN